MPKKHQPNYSKISASRTYSTSSTAPGKDSAKSSASVNQLLSQLRREQTPQAELDKRRDELTAGLSQRTIPPALRRILNIPETEGPPPRTVRPRARRIPGPAPPRSWLEASKHAVHSNIARDRNDPRHDRGSFREFSTLARLKDNNATLPATSSLLHLALKTLARNWESLIEIEQYYIPALPNTQLKSLVLAYIGAYGDEGALDNGGLKLLFANEDVVAGGTGGDDLRLMDLSNLLSARLTLPDINRFFSLQSSELETRLKRLVISSSESQPSSEPADSWECEADHLQLDATSLRTSRFSNLTRLSLFNPGAQASWPHLLRVSAHFSQLTHLSLGYWPAPSATPNALTTSIDHRYGRPINLGGTHFHSLLDNDWYEAANILRRFSKNTYCLKWLDLEGCDWAAALAWGSQASHNQPRGLQRSVTFSAAAVSESGAADRRTLSPDFDDVPTQPDVGPDWNGVWRKVEYINLSQGWVPTDTHIIRQMPAGMLGVELLGYLREYKEDASGESEETGGSDRGHHALGNAPGLRADERSTRHWIEREKKSRRAIAGIRGARAREGGRYVTVGYGWSAPAGSQRRN